MNSEKNGGKLTRWLLIATIVLLALVLVLQLWQMFGRKTYGDNGSLPQDSAASAAPQTTDPLSPPAAGGSPGKTAMIEDVLALNEDLSAADLEKLSAKELEQLRKTGAPGLPIGLSAAAQAVEEYAGTLAVDSVTSETDPELDEAPAHYEVELHHPTLGDFEYKIDAYTGEVLEGTPNILQSIQAADAPREAPASTSGAQQPAAAGEEAAKNAAFTHAGVSSADAANLRCKLDWDDGRQIYEIEFWVGNVEYDYEIDAATYAVIQAEQDQNVAQSGAGQPGSFVGEEAAKDAALTHAKVRSEDAGFIKCELDESDGRWLYEVEFRAGGAKYEYEIDAATGEVVKAELDH